MVEKGDKNKVEENTADEDMGEKIKDEKTSRRPSRY